MNSSETSNPKNIDTEIVIVGAGGAGLAAAVAAAEKGASVTVLEKRRAPGGTSVFAVGLFAAESAVQKRMMIDARRDELFKIAMDYSHWKNNPRIIRAFIDKSADTIQWLEDKGLNFDSIRPLYPNQVPLTWHCPKGGGTSVIKALVKDCKDLGVQLLCQTAAKRIQTSAKGNVTGILAATKEKELRIIAKSVIITTGGYAGNKELLKKYYPSYIADMYSLGLPHMGEGLLMVTEIGAATEGLGILQLHGPHFPGSSYVNAVAQEPNTIWVNKKGERFADETITFSFPECGNAVDRQPDKLSYALFDGKIKRNIIEEGIIRGILHVPHLLPQTKLTELERELQLEADKGRVKISDSWDEIARWIGVAPQVLRTTIDKYNSSCDQGYDEIFAKERRYLVALRTPPYYAIKCYSSFLGTIGGIKINHHMEVLNHQDNPIPGLYAAGTDTGGWESDTYNPVLSGSTFGFAINSGRVAGENAAIYVCGKCPNSND